MLTLVAHAAVNVAVLRNTRAHWTRNLRGDGVPFDSTPISTRKLRTAVLFVGLLIAGSSVQAEGPLGEPAPADLIPNGDFRGYNLLRESPARNSDNINGYGPSTRDPLENPHVTSPRQPTPDVDLQATEALKPRPAYRCVCGEVIEVDPDHGGRCPLCGRRYGPAAVDPVNAETISLDVEAGSPLSDASTPAGGDSGLRIGQRLEHFRVVDSIGRGGMGAVYRAVDESLQRYVALKVIDASLSSGGSDGQVDQLLQEARAQARVNHPNVAHIYYVGASDGAPFLAMELVAGQTLERRLRDGPLPFGEMIRIALQLAGALAQAAQFDIVHRDIKPSNVLFVDDETVKITDFGLALRLSGAGGPGQPLVGTPHYLSPETVRGEPPDIRSDMYALGVTLFRMTFGRLPYHFSGKSPWDAAQTHLSAEVAYPEPWPHDVPEEWHRVLSCLLAKDPSKRYPDYQALIADLRSLQPVDTPSAGRIQRGLAWLVDLSIAVAIQGALFNVASRPAIERFLDVHPVSRLLAMLTTLIAPLLALYLFARWKTSPGKRLFQLRIVARHGMAPAKSLLAVRSFFQLLPVWAVAAESVLVVGLGLKWLDPFPEDIGGMFELIAFVLIAIDAAVALVDRRRRSLHDLLLGTRVVLDTAPEP